MSRSLRAVLVCLLALPAALIGVAPANASQVALGVNAANAPGVDNAALDAFTARVGRAPALVMWYQSWSEPLFYQSQVEAVDARGAVPMVTWEPAGVSLNRIATGAHDAYLREAARSARTWAKPLYVRFAHEMNGDWYSWAKTAANAGGDYVRAWRHVVRVFREQGAANVRWVWAPNVVGNGVGAFESLYPGDAWVDWVGLDGYNWGAAKGSGWRSLSEIFGASYDRLTRLTRKPIMIAEAGAPERGGDKAAWIASALRSELHARLPRVRAFVWFNRLKEADWRAESSPRALAAFRAGVMAPSFGLGRAGLLAVGPSRAAAHPRWALGRMQTRRTRTRVRVSVRLRGRRCRTCRAVLSVSRRGTVHHRSMRVRGHRAVTSVARRRGAVKLRVTLRDGNDRALARSAERRVRRR